jgi:hypothetical protein
MRCCASALASSLFFSTTPEPTKGALQERDEATSEVSHAKGRGYIRGSPGGGFREHVFVLVAAPRFGAPSLSERVGFTAMTVSHLPWLTIISRTSENSRCQKPGFQERLSPATRFP